MLLNQKLVNDLLEIVKKSKPKKIKKVVNQNKLTKAIHITIVANDANIDYVKLTRNLQRKYSDKILFLNFI